MYKEFNPNPNRAYVGDCVIRAICKVMNYDWQKAYLELCMQGFILCDMPSANHVWGSFLKEKGFSRSVIPNNCPDCYTIAEFCEDYPQGTFVLATGTHAVAVIDGDYYDTWNSGNECPIYYWRKEN